MYIEHDSRPDKAPSVERLSEPLFNNLLAGAGNHEAKLLTLAVMASQPDRQFSAYDLYKEMMSRQGDVPAWKPHNQLSFKYASGSLEPIGAVVKGERQGVRKTPTPTYGVNDMGISHGLPLSGALLAWSVNNPDLSLIRVLGSTSSSTDVRSPEVRLKIYNELLTAPDDQVSLKTMGDRISITAKNHDPSLVANQLRDLSRLGIIDFVTTQEDYDPQLQILKPEYWHIGIKFEDLQPETRAIYDAMGQLSADRDIVMASDIERIITASSSDIDIHAVHKRLVRGVNEGTKNFPGLRLIDRGGIDGSARTNVSINEAVVQPLTELVGALDDVANGINYETYAKQAIDIINDPASFNALMRKVKAASPNVVGQTEGREELGERLVRIVRGLGAATLRNLQEELATQGRTMSDEGIRLALRELVQRDALSLTSGDRSPTSRLKVNYYSVKDDEGA